MAEEWVQQKWRVMAETLEGKKLCLRKGFLTEADAEDHPVTPSHWKRVWVEREPIPVKPPVYPELPWTPERRENGSVYIKDATGRNILTVFGSPATREHVLGILSEHGILNDPEA